MTKRVTPDGQSWSGPTFTDWQTDDPWAQEARFNAYAHGRVHIQGQASVGPLVPPGTDTWRLLHLRCLACNAAVGAVWAAASEWQGQSFMWAETCEVRDRSARPPTVRVRNWILDSVTAGFLVKSECFGDGWCGVPVVNLLADASKGVVRLTQRGKPRSVDMAPTTPWVAPSRPAELEADDPEARAARRRRIESLLFSPQDSGDDAPGCS